MFIGKPQHPQHLCTPDNTNKSVLTALATTVILLYHTLSLHPSLCNLTGQHF
jgi:hypothetical protein